MLTLRRQPVPLPLKQIEQQATGLSGDIQNPFHAPPVAWETGGESVFSCPLAGISQTSLIAGLAWRANRRMALRLQSR